MTTDERAAPRFTCRFCDFAAPSKYARKQHEKVHRHGFVQLGEPVENRFSRPRQVDEQQAKLWRDEYRTTYGLSDRANQQGFTETDYRKRAWKE